MGDRDVEAAQAHKGSMAGDGNGKIISGKIVFFSL